MSVIHSRPSLSSQGIPRPSLTITWATVGVTLALAGCGGSSSQSSQQTSSSAEQVSSAGVSVTRPAGWQVSTPGSGGIVLAPDVAGLSATVPTGPRFTAKPAAGVLPDAKTLAGLITSAPRDVRLVAPAGSTTVGGSKGFAITVQETHGGRSIVSEQVVVPLGPGRAYTFLLEAPASQWSTTKTMLTGILDGAGFDLGAVPKATGVISAP